MCAYRNELDPYDIDPDIAERSINRVYFFSNPGSGEWVEESDLPEQTLKALRGRPCDAAAQVEAKRAPTCR